jgi:hypothetical protein
MALFVAPRRAARPRVARAAAGHGHAAPPRAPRRRARRRHARRARHAVSAVSLLCVRVCVRGFRLLCVWAGAAPTLLAEFPAVHRARQAGSVLGHGCAAFEFVGGRELAAGLFVVGAEPLSFTAAAAHRRRRSRSFPPAAAAAGCGWPRRPRPRKTRCWRRRCPRPTARPTTPAALGQSPRCPRPWCSTAAAVASAAAARRRRG